MTRAQLRRHVIPITIGIGLVAFALVFQLSDNTLIKDLRNRMEWVAYDLRLRLTLDNAPEPHADIVIIDIDDKSLAAEGRWPWPREKIALIVEQLATAGTVVTAFDIVFSEPQDNIALNLLEILEKANVDTVVTDTLMNIADQIDGDATLANSLQNYQKDDKGIVLGYAFLSDEAEYGTIALPLSVSNLDQLDNSTIVNKSGFLANLDILQDVAKYGGFFTAEPDDDGTIRRSNLIYRYKDKIYPSLALEAVRLLYFIDDIEIRTNPIGDIDVIEEIDVGGTRVPTNGEGAVLIPYRGPAYSFAYISATDIINGNFNPEQLENKIAFVGASATGLGDVKPTPVSNVFPGVEVHASIAAGLIDMANLLGASEDGNIRSVFPAEPEWAQGLNFIITLLAGLFLALVLPFLSPLRSLLLFAVSAGGLVGFNLWLWTDYNFVVGVASPLMMIFLLSSTNLAYGFLFESQGKKQLREQFGQYVPPALVDQMLSTEDDLGFDGDRREMTVLFADIRSFTTISESLSVTELKDMLNRFFTPMTEIIFNKQGTIDKYVGDMIMAFWGAPLKDDNHAKHAIDGALTMLAKVEAMRPELDALGYPEINLGIGLNTGVMSVGNMGSEFRRAYTVLGDAVNLSSRLEGLTKKYGVKLIVGENTREGQDGYVFRRLDKVTVKGKTEPVIIYEPVCRSEDATDIIRQDIADFDAVLELYYNRDWTEARKCLEVLKAADPDRMIYSIYLERMSSMNEMLLTDDWDGTFEHTSK